MEAVETVGVGVGVGAHEDVNPTAGLVPAFAAVVEPAAAVVIGEGSARADSEFAGAVALACAVVVTVGGTFVGANFVGATFVGAVDCAVFVTAGYAGVVDSFFAAVVAAGCAAVVASG